jgi:hypothetical protein
VGVEQVADVAVPGLGCDPVDRAAVVAYPALTRLRTRALGRVPPVPGPFTGPNRRRQGTISHPMDHPIEARANAFAITFQGRLELGNMNYPNGCYTGSGTSTNTSLCHSRVGMSPSRACDGSLAFCVDRNAEPGWTRLALGRLHRSRRHGGCAEPPLVTGIAADRAPDRGDRVGEKVLLGAVLVGIRNPDEGLEGDLAEITAASDTAAVGAGDGLGEVPVDLHHVPDRPLTDLRPSSPVELL